MIDPKTITLIDIGRGVIYKPHYLRNDPARWERGRLSSISEDGTIFVRFKGSNGEKCKPQDLCWESEHESR